jgi:cytochrome b subunit of formate dehydrogenase
MAKAKRARSEAEKTYTRFDLSQRIEHVIFLVSFSLLGFTGLIQKYSNASISQAMLQTLGGIENARRIHHVSAVVMLLVSIYHILSVLYRVYVRRVSFSMLPVFDDFKHLFEDVMYYFGIRKHGAYYARYNYGEKVEYLAVVWGTIVMAITGFMMWNPIATTRFVPGEAIPAAKAAHGGEAVLAVAAIIIWHFYNVHLKHFNKSMFTGKLSEHEMAHEHPAELALIKAGEAKSEIPPEVLRRRQMIFFPVATVMGLAMIVGVIRFVTLESTAITTIPVGENAPIFVKVTPTPRPTPTPLQPTLTGGGVAANSWDGGFSALFRNRCSTCHGITKVGGLTLATYQSALAGGVSGPGIIPGDPEASTIVQVQTQGDHPGQLTPEELEQVINWINAGAPER